MYPFFIRLLYMHLFNEHCHLKTLDETRVHNNPLFLLAYHDDDVRIQKAKESRIKIKSRRNTEQTRERLLVTKFVKRASTSLSVFLSSLVVKRRVGGRKTKKVKPLFTFVFPFWHHHHHSLLFNTQFSLSVRS